MVVYFDVMHLYYLPQYLPLVRELQRRGTTCRFVVYLSPKESRFTAVDDALMRQVMSGQGLDALYCKDADEALAIFNRERPDWIVFGNAFDPIEGLDKRIRTAMLYHGIGVKDTYYEARQMTMDVRFVEGQFRADELRRRFPGKRIEAVGFAKLDPLCGAADGEAPFDLAAHGLDPARPTVLYAPTFYPSSAGLMPARWPEELADCNVIVKPHQFLFTRPRYRSALKRVQRWAGMPNVHVCALEDFSIIPYFAVADLLVSEASSALFEFAALDRPVVWCDFLDLRFEHRIFRRRFEKKMDRTIYAYADVAAHAAKPGDVTAVVRGELAAPGRLADVRRAHSAALIGPTDGRVSVRIADWLERHRDRLPDVA